MTTTNAALGHFLRTRRERLHPAAFGLPAGRRRTPGLRRDEVAAAAGISAEWYVKLEQGRAVAPSSTTVDALARALRLDRAERAHLRHLARGHDRAPFAREDVPDTIRHLLEGLPHPAYVTGLRWDVLAWNAAAAELLCDFAAVPEAERNILLFMFTDPRARALFGPAWAEEAQRMLALFRATHDLWAGDPAFADLVGRLRTGSADFAGWWCHHDVRAPTAGEKALHVGGAIRRYAYATFQANDDPALKLALYTPTPVDAPHPHPDASGSVEAAEARSGSSQVM